MRNIKLTIEYEGTDFFGWQIQNNSKKRTVQGEIEKALKKIIRQNIGVTGAARTDRGVHATGQVANFLTNDKIHLSRLRPALNSVLPKDVAIVAIEEVPLSFNARYWAKGKIYQYTILNCLIPRPLARRMAWFIPVPLDVHLMKKTAKFFLGEHNFSLFACQGSSRKRECCKITGLEIASGKGAIRIEIKGTNFLYKMVRRIVGALVEVGRGKIEPQAVKNALLSGVGKFYLPTAPAKGLCLKKVSY